MTLPSRAGSAGDDRLVTERLVLRRPAARDAEGFVRFARSQRARWSIGHKDRAGAWRSFALELGHWELRGYGMFAVTAKGDDTCLGLVGLWFPEGWPEREVGWLLWDGAEGKGYASEAARACLGYAFDRLGWDTAVSYVDETNARSIALCERLGAVWDQGAATLGNDCRVYRHGRAAA